MAGGHTLNIKQGPGPRNRRHPSRIRAGQLFFPRSGDQRLTVGDRNLVVIRMNFRESQKPVAIAAVVDEGRLQRRLDAHDLGEINVAA